MLIIDTRWTGQHGIARFSSEVISRLDVEFCALDRGPRPSSPLDIFNAQRVRLGSGDVVYSPGYNVGLTRARQVATVHDLIHLHVNSESSRAKSAYYDRVLRPAIQRAGVVLTVSETSAAAITEWLGHDEVSVVNVGNGCSDVFSPEGGAYVSERDYLLYVGNTKPHKNFSVLLAALSLRPDYDLVVVTGAKDEAEREATERGVAERVTVFATVTDDELAALYRGSKGLLFPSLLEGFGLPAVEAMRSGKRVAFWQGCSSLAEIVGQSGHGVGSAVSAEGWAAAMDDLVSDSSLTGLEDELQKYSWANVAGGVRRELQGLSS